jgi:hypothetical protein
VRWQLQARGRQLLIAAIARSLLADLADIAARHGLVLRSVQPELCAQWNRHARALRRGPAVFAVAGAQGATIATVADGAITALGRGPGLDRGAIIASGLHPLDARVDRLLASLGLDAVEQSGFVLVAQSTPVRSLSQRWRVVGRGAGAS